MAGPQVIDEKILEDVKNSIQKGDEEALRAIMDQLRAADLADLVEHLDPPERSFVFKCLEPEGAGEVLVEIEPPFQEAIVSELDDQVLTEIVEELDSDDAADLVGDLPTERARAIMESVEREVSKDLEKLLPYPDETAGGLMALEYVAVREDATVEEAIEVIRSKKEEVENVYYLFVVDYLGRLVGVVSLKDLVTEFPRRKIREIMNREVISVNVEADQEEVATIVKKYDLVAIPVVDDKGRLVGRITHDDVVDVIEDEASEDMTLMAGVIGQEIAEESPFKISAARIPWLIAGLLGGIVAAVVINQFESSLEKILALSFFFPVIMAMGGNTGTQAATVAVRGLATGDISIVNAGKRLLVELKVALMNGLICGIILGLIVGMWLSDFYLGVVVFLSLVIIIINSGFIGTAVPLALKKLGIDPALATGPFVTTTNDIISLFIYLGLVTLSLKLRGAP